MKPSSLSLSLSSIGASSSQPDNRLGTLCAQSGYIRSDTRCALRSNLLIETRRTVLQGRSDMSGTLKCCAARAQVMAWDIMARAQGASLVAAAHLRDAVKRAGWPSMDTMLTGYLSSLVRYAGETDLPETEDEAQRMLLAYINRKGGKESK